MIKKKKLVIGLVALVIVAIGFGVYQYIPKHNVFVRVGDMNIPRSGHKAVLLKDGQVLILGGDSENTAEIYNPIKRNFKLIGKMHKGNGDTATLLNDGRVLITGINANAELFDPKTEQFKLIDGMNYPRAKATATLLKNGRVIIVGGESGKYSIPVCCAEIYNPKTNKFEIGSTLNVPRFDHNAILLNDGNVLIVGGMDNKERFYSAELYDVKSNKFIKLKNNMFRMRVSPQVVKLKDGNVLIIGGYAEPDSPYRVSRENEAIEIYNPIKQDFKFYIENSLTPTSGKAVLLNDGNVLITAGSKRERWYFVATKDSAILNTNKKEIIKGPNLNQKRAGNTVTTLSDGTALITGGTTVTKPKRLKSSELYIL